MAEEIVILRSAVSVTCFSLTMQTIKLIYGSGVKLMVSLLRSRLLPVCSCRTGFLVS